MRGSLTFTGSKSQNKSGILWNAIRVGAALYAASIVAGASVLIPYFSFS
jgi:hypothetical protein